MTKIIKLYRDDGEENHNYEVVDGDAVRQHVMDNIRSPFPAHIYEEMDLLAGEGWAEMSESPYFDEDRFRSHIRKGIAAKKIIIDAFTFEEILDKMVEALFKLGYVS